MTTVSRSFVLAYEVINKHRTGLFGFQFSTISRMCGDLKVMRAFAPCSTVDVSDTKDRYHACMHDHVILPSMFVESTAKMIIWLFISLYQVKKRSYES